MVARRALELARLGDVVALQFVIIIAIVGGMTGLEDIANIKKSIFCKISLGSFTVGARG